jgi:hypothetical protein
MSAATGVKRDPAMPRNDATSMAHCRKFHPQP